MRPKTLSRRLTLEYTPGSRTRPERPNVHHRQIGGAHERQQRHAALLRAGGLVKPAGKSPAGYRLYDKDSVRRIHFIKHAQQCGFTLAEIRELLVLRGRDKAYCGDVRSRAVEKKLHIESKIRAMKAMS